MSPPISDPPKIFLLFHSLPKPATLKPVQLGVLRLLNYLKEFQHSHFQYYSALVSSQDQKTRWNGWSCHDFEAYLQLSSILQTNCSTEHIDHEENEKSLTRAIKSSLLKLEESLQISNLFSPVKPVAGKKRPLQSRFLFIFSTPGNALKQIFANISLDSRITLIWVTCDKAHNDRLIEKTPLGYGLALDRLITSDIDEIFTLLLNPNLKSIQFDSNQLEMAYNDSVVSTIQIYALRPCSSFSFGYEKMEIIGALDQADISIDDCQADLSVGLRIFGDLGLISSLKQQKQFAIVMVSNQNDTKIGFVIPCEQKTAFLAMACDGYKLNKSLIPLDLSVSPLKVEGEIVQEHSPSLSLDKLKEKLKETRETLLGSLKPKHVPVEITRQNDQNPQEDGLLDFYWKYLCSKDSVISFITVWSGMKDGMRRKYRSSYVFELFKQSLEGIVLGMDSLKSFWHRQADKFKGSETSECLPSDISHLIQMFSRKIKNELHVESDTFCQYMASREAQLQLVIILELVRSHSATEKSPKLRDKMTGLQLGKFKNVMALLEHRAEELLDFLFIKLACADSSALSLFETENSLLSSVIMNDRYSKTIPAFCEKLSPKFSSTFFSPKCIRKPRQIETSSMLSEDNFGLEDASQPFSSLTVTSDVSRSTSQPKFKTISLRTRRSSSISSTLSQEVRQSEKPKINSQSFYGNKEKKKASLAMGSLKKRIVNSDSEDEDDNPFTYMTPAKMPRLANNFLDSAPNSPSPASKKSLLPPLPSSKTPLRGKSSLNRLKMNSLLIKS